MSKYQNWMIVSAGGEILACLYSDSAVNAMSAFRRLYAASVDPDGSAVAIPQDVGNKWHMSFAERSSAAWGRLD